MKTVDELFRLTPLYYAVQGDRGFNVSGLSFGFVLFAFQDLIK